jgi:serine/threonine protein kinase
MSGRVEPPPSDGLSPQCQAIRRRFAREWRTDPTPQLSSYLDGVSDPQQRSALLHDLVQIDLEFRHKDGQPTPLESYCREHPELTADPQTMLSLIASEMRLRLRIQGDLAPQEYQDRFPEFRDQLPSLLAEVTRLDETPVFNSTAHGHPTDGRTLPVVAGYEVLEVLGRGGMGVVYKARHLTLDRLVALKMIRGDQDGPSGEARCRFQAEAVAFAALQHPHVVQLLEIGECDGRPFFSLEYMAGGSLADRTGGRAQPPRRAAETVEVLARAVQAVHERGMVHRDLKPGNVLLTADGTPKIGDFGLAKRLEGAERLTQSGAVVGTPAYMAPEQAGGRAEEVGPATDVYALGAILDELLFGRPPFRGDTPLLTAGQRSSPDATALTRRERAAPRDLRAICRKCLEREPADRYASAQELADDLRRFLNGEPVRCRPVGWGERLLKWARRRPAVAALAVLVPALLAALLVVLSLGRRDSPSARPTIPPEPPAFAWDFTNGDAQSTTGQGTEIISASRFGNPPLKGGSHLRFRQGGFSWMRATFTLPADLPTASGQWLLKVYHTGTSSDIKGVKGHSPARISLNEQTVWEGDPDGPAELLVPGGLAWKKLERDVSAMIRPGENVLRWDHLHGATTNYWLKSFRVCWTPSP